MSRNLLASMMVAALLATPALAATGSPAAKKGKKETFASRRVVSVAPAEVVASGPSVDVGPIDSSANLPPVDAYPVDQPTSGGGATVCFTGDMLCLYLDWLGVSLQEALRYGFLQDQRLLALFFEALAQQRAQSGAKKI